MLGASIRPVLTSAVASFCPRIKQVEDVWQRWEVTDKNETVLLPKSDNAKREGMSPDWLRETLLK